MFTGNKPSPEDSHPSFFRRRPYLASASLARVSSPAIWQAVRSKPSSHSTGQPWHRVEARQGVRCQRLVAEGTVPPVSGITQDRHCYGTARDMHCDGVPAAWMPVRRYLHLTGRSIGDLWRLGRIGKAVGSRENVRIEEKAGVSSTTLSRIADTAIGSGQ